MKKKLRILIAVVCCCTMIFGLVSTVDAATLKADVVTAKVTLNGQVIDNKNAEYPLLMYSNITYFPMTYHLSRFMGVATTWDNTTRTLNITAGAERSAYKAETGKPSSGKVTVTLPEYQIFVNNAKINNSKEAYPIFSYKDITYFPLTYAYAADAFGWGYQWDFENGLRIDTTTAIKPVSTDPNTGNANLDAALKVLNSAYAAGGKYKGTLSDKNGNTQSFDGKLEIIQYPDSTYAYFSAEPFPFFDKGVRYRAVYSAKKGGFAGDYAEEGGISCESQSIPEGTHHYVDVTQEKFYIGECFLDCQFAGERSKRITNSSVLSTDGSVTTWKLDVSYDRIAAKSYVAEISVDSAKSAVTKIVIKTANQTLTMIPA